MKIQVEISTLSECLRIVCPKCRFIWRELYISPQALFFCPTGDPDIDPNTSFEEYARQRKELDSYACPECGTKVDPWGRLITSRDSADTLSAAIEDRN